MPEVTLESETAVPVLSAFGKAWDQTGALGPLTIASNRAVSVGEADPKIEGHALICPRIAESVQRTVEVLETGDQNLPRYGLWSVDRTADEEEHCREQ